MTTREIIINGIKIADIDEDMCKEYEGFTHEPIEEYVNRIVSGLNNDMQIITEEDFRYFKIFFKTSYHKDSLSKFIMDVIKDRNSRERFSANRIAAGKPAPKCCNCCSYYDVNKVDEGLCAFYMYGVGSDFWCESYHE